jgi:hypothetical protein
MRNPTRDRARRLAALVDCDCYNCGSEHLEWRTAILEKALLLAEARGLERFTKARDSSFDQKRPYIAIVLDLKSRARRTGAKK